MESPDAKALQTRSGNDILLPLLLVVSTSQQQKLQGKRHRMAATPMINTCIIKQDGAFLFQN